jgi:hypothetical protein
MRVEVWSTVSSGKVTYHCYFDEFDSIEEAMLLEKKEGLSDLVFETGDPQVLIKKILKNVEKEVKHQIKNDK